MVLKDYDTDLKKQKVHLITMYYSMGGSDHLLDIKQYYLFIVICLNRAGSRNNLWCFPDFKTDLHEVNVHRNTGEKNHIF